MSGRAFFIVLMFHWSVWMLQERSRASPKYRYPSIMSNRVCNTNSHVLYRYPSIKSNRVCNTNSHVLYRYPSIMSNRVCNTVTCYNTGVNIFKYLISTSLRSNTFSLGPFVTLQHISKWPCKQVAVHY